MGSFMAGDTDSAMADFDAAAEDPNVRPFLWQRGLSLYYAGRFGEAREQFLLDVAGNPNDLEELLWAYASDARAEGERCAASIRPRGPARLVQWDAASRAKATARQHRLSCTARTARGSYTDSAVGKPRSDHTCVMRPMLGLPETARQRSS